MSYGECLFDADSSGPIDVDLQLFSIGDVWDESQGSGIEKG